MAKTQENVEVINMTLNDLIKERDALNKKIAEIENSPFKKGSIFYIYKIYNLNGGLPTLYKLKLLSNQDITGPIPFEQHCEGGNVPIGHRGYFHKDGDKYILDKVGYSGGEEEIFRSPKEAMQHLRVQLTHQLIYVLNHLK